MISGQKRRSRRFLLRNSRPFHGLSPDSNCQRGHQGSPENRPTIKPGTLTPTRALIGSVGMSKVLSEDKKQQIIVLQEARMAFTAHRASPGVRRETAGVYLKAAGIAVRVPGAW